MGDTTVYRLGPNDVALAARVARELAGVQAVAVVHLADMLTDPRSVVVATLVAGEPVGYLVAYSFPSLSGERLVYLYDIEVSVGHRRRGVATAMVRELLAVCRQAGVESIWVGSSLTNHAACELWRATGAQRDGDQYVEFTFDLCDA